VLWTFQGASLYHLPSRFVVSVGDNVALSLEFAPVLGEAYAVCVAADPVTGAVQLAAHTGPRNLLSGQAEATYAPVEQAGLMLGPSPSKFLEVVQLSAFLRDGDLQDATSKIISRWAGAPQAAVQAFFPPQQAPSHAGSPPETNPPSNYHAEFLDASSYYNKWFGWD
jgi:hypothetical protein